MRLSMGRRVVIVPGNGCDCIEDSNWYGWMAEELCARGVDVVCRDFPDPFEANKE